MSRMSAQDIDLKGFRAWLAGQGVSLEESPNEYEVVRYRVNRKIGSIFSRPTKRQFTICGVAVEHYALFQKGEAITAIEVPSHAAARPGELVLYTDASNYHQTGAGAWGAVLILPDGREIEASGPLKGEVTSSSDAEAKAVANAVHRFLRDGHILPGSQVRVIGDNMWVIKYVGGRSTKKSKSQGIKDAIEYLKTLQRRFRLTIRSEWVKGHQPPGSLDPRAKYNNRCDVLCTAHSKKLDRERRLSATIEATNAAAQEVRA